VKEVSDVTACVLDSGQFLPVATRLAEDCKRVIFCQPCEKTPATIKSAVIGDGFPDVECVRDFWSLIDEIDLFVVPDCQHSGLQLYLESIGKAVWGNRSADVLELNRPFLMKMLEELGLDVPEFKVFHGLTELCDYLIGAEDKYIKVSRYRGDMETHHWRNWEQDECWIDSMRVWLGPTGDKIKFLVFDAIDTDLELGGDSYNIDGRWPGLMLNGIEWKDKSYFSAVVKRAQAPEQTRAIMDAFSQFLQERRYRQFWSMEVRVKELKNFFIDATVRAGLPSSATQQLIWKNYSKIIWLGANGILVEPEPVKMFSIETMVQSKPEGECWDVVPLPKKLQRNFRAANCAQIDGKLCFPPNEMRGHDLGWLCAIGDSPKEALAEIKRLADLLPDGLNAKVEDLAGVLKEIDTAMEEGIPITQAPVPEPAAAIE
jgi:hypothetical protein